MYSLSRHHIKLVWPFSSRGPRPRICWSSSRLLPPQLWTALLRAAGQIIMKPRAPHVFFWFLFGGLGKGPGCEYLVDRFMPSTNQRDGSISLWTHHPQPECRHWSLIPDFCTWFLNALKFYEKKGYSSRELKFDHLWLLCMIVRFVAHIKKKCLRNWWALDSFAL